MTRLALFVLFIPLRKPLGLALVACANINDQSMNPQALILVGDALYVGVTTIRVVALYWLRLILVGCSILIPHHPWPGAVMTEKAASPDHNTFMNYTSSNLVHIMNHSWHFRKNLERWGVTLGKSSLPITHYPVSYKTVFLSIEFQISCVTVCSYCVLFLYSVTMNANGAGDNQRDPEYRPIELIWPPEVLSKTVHHLGGGFVFSTSMDFKDKDLVNICCYHAIGSTDITPDFHWEDVNHGKGKGKGKDKGKQSHRIDRGFNTDGHLFYRYSPALARSGRMPLPDQDDSHGDNDDQSNRFVGLGRLNTNCVEISRVPIGYTGQELCRWLLNMCSNSGITTPISVKRIIQSPGMTGSTVFSLWDNVDEVNFLFDKCNRVRQVNRTTNDITSDTLFEYRFKSGSKLQYFRLRARAAPPWERLNTYGAPKASVTADEYEEILTTEDFDSLRSKHNLTSLPQVGQVEGDCRTLEKDADSSDALCPQINVSHIAITSKTNLDGWEQILPTEIKPFDLDKPHKRAWQQLFIHSKRLSLPIGPLATTPVLPTDVAQEDDVEDQGGLEADGDTTMSGQEVNFRLLGNKRTEQVLSDAENPEADDATISAVLDGITKGTIAENSLSQVVLAKVKSLRKHKKQKPFNG